MVFDFMALHLGNGEIEFRSQLITNRKSYMDFKFVQKSMILNGQSEYVIIGSQKVIC